MNLNIKINKDIKEIASFVSYSVNKQLELGKNVLFIVSGGSCILLEIEISKMIKEFTKDKLVVILGDERYGVVDHENSNWFKLKEAGFNIKNAKLIPILIGKDINTTTSNFKEVIKYELNNAEYVIGLFGIGIDGHTAGILPHSEALNENELVCSYKSETYNRITITPKTIYMLDEAVVYAADDSKWQAIERLKEDLPIEDEPAQTLKRVPVLTIFAKNDL